MVKKAKKKQISKPNVNFDIGNFEIDNYYLFIVTKFNYLLFGLNDYNEIKPKNNEITILQKEIEDCFEDNRPNKDFKVIKIHQTFYQMFKNMKQNDLRYTEYGQKITFIINYLKQQNETITLKKIMEKYITFYNKKISVSTISRILKNHLNIRYLKTSLKNPKLEEKNYIIMSFVFIKGIIRSLFLNLNLIFVDETGFLLENNNFYTWRNSEDQIIKGPKTKVKDRTNLILAVSKNKVILKKFTKLSVDSKMFIEFLTDIIKDLDDEEKKKIIIIYDNATYHISKDVIEFFKNNKIKGLTNCPYRSYFNMIELVFRYVKNIIYKNVYNKMDDLIKDANKILESENLRKSLINLYKETLEKYKIFIQDNLDFNLN